MKILSWNVRGLGGFAKRPEVRNLIKEKNPSIVCIQETKLYVIDGLCASLWGSVTQSYSYRPAVGASGGLLTMWDSSSVVVWSSFSLDHVLIIHGCFTDTNDEFYLFNVYAPCDNGAKQLLWNSLTEQLQGLVGNNICLCGDFNAAGVWKKENREEYQIATPSIALLILMC
jgi:exonuclease III